MDEKKYFKLVRSLNFKPSSLKLFTHLIIDTSIVLLIHYSVSTVFLFSQLLVPILMFRMFALMHDCLHGAASKYKSINLIIGIFSGVFCLLPYEPWKKIHLEHHKWSGNIDKDPSMGQIKSFNANKKWQNTVRTFCWNYWIPLSAITQHFVFWSKSYTFILKSQKKGEGARNFFSILVPIGIYSQIYWPNYILGIILYLILVEVINFPHHLQRPMVNGERKIKIYNQHITTRSCNYPKFFANFVLNNFNLHIEHHLFPALPWYRLEKIREILKQDLNDKYTEVPNNQWILNNRSKDIEEIFSPNLINDDQWNKITKGVSYDRTSKSTTS